MSIYNVSKPDFSKSLWIVGSALLAFMMAVLPIVTHWSVSYLLVAGILGVPISVILVKYVRTGVYTLILVSMTLNIFRMLLPQVPVGIGMDYIILLMVLSCLFHDLNTKKFTFFKSPLTWAIFLWIGWHMLELMNPDAASRTAWFYVMRPAVGYIMLFFVTYRMFNTLKSIRQLLKYLWWLLFLSGTWGLIQYFNGYFKFEMDFLEANDMIHLVYIQGRWRCFGTLGSPSQFGVAMAVGCVLSFMMFWVKGNTFEKIMYAIGGVVMMLSLVYSGTRTAYAVIPVGIGLMVVLAKNAKLYFFGLIGGACFWVLMILPTNNYHIKRIQSTFNSEEDASYLVRKQNRELITPYILSHPMGGGLGSTGVWGQRFSPNTFLANFPPDSGYMRVAVEMGWVGLIVYLMLWGRIILNTIMQYYGIKQREYRWLGMAILTSTLPLCVVEYAQDIISKLPFNVLFWVLIALAINCNKLGAKEREKDAIT
ncbi:O-antigen ligase family protein [Algivirga pacifica]|uniref:O-antigen ligase-related domain-containing protein n=1 Tax=Algivirga pacifica TaxID=1162670 RepID=A0ABP9DFH6_9BACT